MTGESKSTTADLEEAEADGWGVIHINPNPGPDHAPEYMLGPLPIKELADLIKAASTCGCTTRVIPLFFPPGLAMVMTVPDRAHEDPPPIH